MNISLVIDLDGTLLRSDLLVESWLAYIRAYPRKFFLPFVWLVNGKAHLKENLARHAALDVTSLPYNSQVLDFIKFERSKGRHIVLATASHQSLAEAVAAHLGLFDRYMGTKGHINLSAHSKRNALVEEFGVNGFDYMGNSHDDLPVWVDARKAIVVDPGLGVMRRVRDLGKLDQEIRSSSMPWDTWPKALRLHQWVKNFLLFIPLLASHALQANLLIDALIAFICFGLCASSAYLLNDLLDLPDDRQHNTKRARPLASGALPLLHGLFAFPLLVLLGFSISLWLLPHSFTLCLVAYYCLTLAYSLALKRMMVVDVIVLAMLYTLRIIAGSLAIGVVLTFWMLAFSMFIFLSMALIKRYEELRQARSKGSDDIARGRGYYPSDLEIISSMGAAAGYLSVLVLALYIQDQETLVLYTHPEMIWPACPLLLFWVSRMWLIAHRGGMHDDPVVFTVSDRVSWAVGLLIAASFWFAI